MKNWKWEHPLFYVPLVFLGFPILGVFVFGYPMWTLILTAIFTMCYIYLVHAQISKWTNLVWLILLAYIVYMSLFINSGMLWFFFYVNSLLVYRFQDTLKSFRFISQEVVSILTLLYGIIMGYDLSFIFMATFLLIVNISMFFFWTIEMKKDQVEKALYEKNKSINLLLAENERNRIGQDLHDSLGHVFAMISVKVDLVQELLNRGDIEKSKQEVADLQLISKSAMKDVRELVTGLQEHTIASELIILQNMLELAGIKLDVKNQEAAQSLETSLQNRVSMILRELANNLIKHSQAQHCFLTFQKEDQNFCLTYQDDGVGFSQLTGQELHSIKDRLVPIEGELTISSLGQPTQIDIIIPLRN
ncbi:histidine kinase [Streptococcus uberis]|nr:histidine kinase [Streptococcus uberis]